MTWGIVKHYRPKPVEIVKETAQTVLYIDAEWRNRETRASKDKFLPFRGSETAARWAVERLTSALAERDRREREAREAYAKIAARILEDASGMSAGTAATVQPAQGDSPPARPEGDAHE